MAALIVPPFTLLQAMERCGLPANAAAAFATEVYMDDFETCKDITDEDLHDAFKTFSGLTVAQGQIRVLPGQKKKIKAFSHWVKDQYRRGLDPSSTIFPVDETIALLNRASTHKQYLNKAKTLANAAKPEKFTKDLVWDEWAITFVNYLRAIPGRNGVPLQYVIRSNEQPDPTPNEDFLDDYIKNAPLDGEAFIIDSNEVHTHLINMIAHNNEAESITKVHEKERNGRNDWLALTNHYEGQGVYASNITKAEHDLNNLHYTGEKKPHMWWTLFEQRLNSAFQTYVKFENRIVHSDSHKLRILMAKVKCEWMGDIRGSIETKLTEKPMTFTYAQALQAFKTKVNKKFPPGTTATNTRRISEMSGGRGQRGRGGGRGRGYGGRNYGGRGYGRGRQNQGRGRGGYGNQKRNDSKTITLKDGQKIEYHPSFRFTDALYEKFTNEQKDMLKSQRNAYNGRTTDSTSSYGNNNRQIQEQMRHELDEIRSIMSRAVPNSVTLGQLSTGSTIMGGRNEQANKRKRDE
jgi:hypothetical protein